MFLELYGLITLGQVLIEDTRPIISSKILVKHVQTMNTRVSHDRDAQRSYKYFLASCNFVLIKILSFRNHV